MPHELRLDAQRGRWLANYDTARRLELLLILLD